MKTRFFLLVVGSIILSACAPTPTPPPATFTPSPAPTSSLSPTPVVLPTPAPFFSLFSADPIVPKGKAGAWDDRFTDPGAVIYHIGVFHMFRNGFRAFPGTSQVGYVTSEDGFTWTKQGDEPVFTTAQVSYAKIAMYASSVLVEDDGTWVLYFYTWDSEAFPSSGVIGRATASAPQGPWMADAEPVLLPGSQREWDGKQVLAPHVIKTDSGYLMYYSGTDFRGDSKIGLATSVDGIHWTKYNDPGTNDASNTESDPVLINDSSGDWDAGIVHQPRVFQTDAGWLMLYRGTAKDNSHMALGIATSEDGLSWTKATYNPVFVPSEIPQAKFFWFNNALLVNDTLYLFVEGDINQRTQIYLLTRSAELP